MLKRAVSYTLSIFLFTSCANLKKAFNGPGTPAITTVVQKKESKFIEQISVPVESGNTVVNKDVKVSSESKPETQITEQNSFPYHTTENLLPLQIKYSLLLNTPAAEVKNIKMVEFVDDWYGTPYHLGGTTKRGVDCSAFSQFLFSAVYNISLPRTAKDQYRNTNRISRTELKEGDLIFFNTRGGISHVGVYLQNNKFVHASASGGVMISDIFDPYWLRRFVGVGRVKEQYAVAGGQ